MTPYHALLCLLAAVFLMYGVRYLFVRIRFSLAMRRLPNELKTDASWHWSRRAATEAACNALLERALSTQEISDIRMGIALRHLSSIDKWIKAPGARKESCGGWTTHVETASHKRAREDADRDIERKGLGGALKKWVDDLIARNNATPEGLRYAALARRIAEDPTYHEPPDPLSDRVDLALHGLTVMKHLLRLDSFRSGIDEVHRSILTGELHRRQLHLFSGDGTVPQIDPYVAARVRFDRLHREVVALVRANIPYITAVTDALCDRPVDAEALEGEQGLCYVRLILDGPDLAAIEAAHPFNDPTDQAQAA